MIERKQKAGKEARALVELEGEDEGIQGHILFLSEVWGKVFG